MNGVTSWGADERADGGTSGVRALVCPLDPKNSFLFLTVTADLCSPLRLVDSLRKISDSSSHGYDMIGILRPVKKLP